MQAVVDGKARQAQGGWICRGDLPKDAPTIVGAFSLFVYF